MPLVYPPSPENFDKTLLTPSEDFRKAVRKTIWSLLLFVLVYLIFFALALGLVAASVFAFISIIKIFAHLITFVLGGALVIMSLMLFYFFVKFIFKTSKTDRSGMTEVTLQNEPELVEFIYRVADDCGAQRPKHIYLSNDVNAFVFYDSSILSLFFPIKKNLVIGMGLLNSINLSELKSVLGHEFGHFSQESMRLGNFVYQVNRVLFNLVSEDDNFRILLQQWGSWGTFFALFANLTYSIVQGFQKILLSVYEFVNVRYMSLSRQMEFHADLVAASVSGANHSPSSLYRLELSQWSFNELMNDLEHFRKLNYKPANFFVLHRLLMQINAKNLDIAINNGLPLADERINNFRPHPRINISNQWESHPEISDRAKQLAGLPETPVMNDSPWVLFKSAEELQRVFSDKLYDGITFENTPLELTADVYDHWYKEETAKYKAPDFYGRYYLHQDLKLPTAEVLPPENVAELFSDEQTTKNIKLQAIKNDIELALMIRDKKVKVSTFDFDGVKYKSRQIEKVLASLRHDERELSADVENNDNKIAGLFFSAASTVQRKDELTNDYNNLIRLKTLAEAVIETAGKFRDQILPLIYMKLTHADIEHILVEGYALENKFKTALNDLMIMPGLVPEILPADYDKLMSYYSTKTQYFKGSEYNQEHLELMQSALSLSVVMASKSFFAAKRRLLTKQLELIK